jgi:hypothetical protein
MALYVRKVQLSPSVRMGHVKALEKTSCKYPVNKSKCNFPIIYTNLHRAVNFFLDVNPLLSVVLLSCCPGVSLYHITPVN